MGGLEDRLRRVEAAADAAREYTIPIEAKIVLKRTARLQAREAKGQPPPFDEDELRELHRRDLAAISGELVELRLDPAWRQPEAQQLIDCWEREAAGRLEMCQRLSLREVYDVREETNHKKGKICSRSAPTHKPTQNASGKND